MKYKPRDHIYHVVDRSKQLASSKVAISDNMANNHKYISKTRTK